MKASSVRERGGGVAMPKATRNTLTRHQRDEPPRRDASRRAAVAWPCAREARWHEGHTNLRHTALCITRCFWSDDSCTSTLVGFCHGVPRAGNSSGCLFSSRISSTLPALAAGSTHRTLVYTATCVSHHSTAAFPPPLTTATRACRILKHFPGTC